LLTYPHVPALEHVQDENNDNNDSEQSTESQIWASFFHKAWASRGPSDDPRDHYVAAISRPAWRSLGDRLR